MDLWNLNSYIHCTVGLYFARLFKQHLTLRTTVQSSVGLSA